MKFTQVTFNTNLLSSNSWSIHQQNNNDDDHNIRWRRLSWWKATKSLCGRARYQGMT